MRIMNIAFFQHFFQATLFEDYDIWELLDKMCLFQAQQQQQCYNIFLETSVLILKAETIMAHLNQEPSILKWSDCCTIKLSEHWSSAVSFLHFIFCPCKLLISPYRLEFFFFNARNGWRWFALCLFVFCPCLTAFMKDLKIKLIQQQQLPTQTFDKEMFCRWICGGGKQSCFLWTLSEHCWSFIPYN